MFNQSKMQMETLNNCTVYQFEADTMTLQYISSQISFVLVIFGIIGNVLCIYAFLHKELLMRKFNLYLLTLAIFEFIFCITVFIDHLYRMVNIQPLFLHDINLFTNIFIDFFMHTSESYAAIISLLLSIDRLYAIKHPMKIKTFITNAYPERLIFVTFLVLVMFKLPGLFICHHKSFNEDSKTVYCSLVSPLIMNILPKILILILNGVLVKEIINYYRIKPIETLCLLTANRVIIEETGQSTCIFNSFYFNSKRLSRTQKSHYFILMMCGAWSVFSTIPYYFFKTYCALSHFEIMLKIFNLKTIFLLKVIFSIFFHSNYCINFLIYLSFYSAFRKSILKLFSNLNVFKLSNENINEIANFRKRLSSSFAGIFLKASQENLN